MDTGKWGVSKDGERVKFQRAKECSYIHLPSDVKKGNHTSKHYNKFSEISVVTTLHSFGPSHSAFIYTFQSIF